MTLTFCDEKCLSSILQDDFAEAKAASRSTAASQSSSAQVLFMPFYIFIIPRYILILLFGSLLFAPVYCARTFRAPVITCFS